MSFDAPLRQTLTTTTDSIDEAVIPIDYHGSRVDAVSFEDTLRLIRDWARGRESRRVCFAGVPTIIYSRDSEHFREVHGSADLVLPDGMPMVWALRRTGFPDQQRLCGPDLIFSLCEDAARHQIPVGFYGNTPDTLAKIRSNLTRLYPGLDIRYTFSPPFRSLSEAEEQEILDEIHRSGVQILFVGLGCPKQDFWMARQQERAGFVMIAIGAAFEVAAGNQKRPPLWMQKSGLHWFYRLLNEPHRLKLWERYIYFNMRYLLIVVRSLFGRAMRSKRASSE